MLVSANKTAALVVAALAITIAGTAASLAAPEPGCRWVSGPVNHGKKFYGVTCKHSACYCRAKVCDKTHRVKNVTCEKLTFQMGPK